VVLPPVCGDVRFLVRWGLAPWASHLFCLLLALVVLWLEQE